MPEDAGSMSDDAGFIPDEAVSMLDFTGSMLDDAGSMPVRILLIPGEAFYMPMGFSMPREAYPMLGEACPVPTEVSTLCEAPIGRRPSSARRGSNTRGLFSAQRGSYARDLSYTRRTRFFAQ